ncbi:MAG: hypothetical protein PHI28_04180 [Mangrovibacterium sp.]|nr:hypothetical protein [Mangrovibacterium sp.]
MARIVHFCTLIACTVIFNLTGMTVRNVSRDGSDYSVNEESPPA